MANLIRPKIGLSVFSIFILVLIPLLKSKFNAPVIIKRWNSKLEWNDFQGLPEVFTRFSAAVSSRVYLEFDSLNDRYYAYAGQNNINSWVKSKYTSSISLLNHEQYHFNIAELHSRILNEYITKNPDKTFEEYLNKLNFINGDLNIMQDQYDEESGHSVYRDKQNYWEYRIDSMLSVHSSDSGWITDNYSGAQMYFSSKPEFMEGVNASNVFRGYYLNKYGVNLNYLCFQINGENIVDSMKSYLQHYYNVRKAKVLSFNAIIANEQLSASVTSMDSLNYITHYRWLMNKKHVYKVAASFPVEEGDTIGYSKVGQSFINSFSVINTDAYWINQAKELDDEVREMGKNGFFRRKGVEGCYQVQSSLCVFYREPICTETGSMIIPYDVIDVDDSLLDETVLLLNATALRFKAKDWNHFFFLNVNLIPNDSFRISMGYTLRKDSVGECQRFYGQNLKVNKIETKGSSYNSSTPK